MRDLYAALASNMKALLESHWLLCDGGVFAAAFYGAQGRLLGSGKLRIACHELIKTHVPMDARVRRTWRWSSFRQGPIHTHCELVFGRLFSDDRMAGDGEADTLAGTAQRNLASIAGGKPWGHLLAYRLGGILVAVYDPIGKAVGVPMAQLFAPRTNSHIQEPWWSQYSPMGLLACKARLCADPGYRVHNVKQRTSRTSVARADAICEVHPPDLGVRMSANRWQGSVGQTLSFVRRHSKFQHCIAVESPFPLERVGAYLQLKGTWRKTSTTVQGRGGLEISLISMEPTEFASDNWSGTEFDTMP